MCSSTYLRSLRVNSKAEELKNKQKIRDYLDRYTIKDMNKTEHKIFRGLIEKNLSDQNAFTDSDGEGSKHTETIFKTEMSNYQNYSINTTTPYLNKCNSSYNYPKMSLNENYNEANNDSASYSKIRDSLVNDYPVYENHNSFNTPSKYRISIDIYN